MSTFKKLIVRPGRYRDANGVVHEVTSDRIQKWVDTAQKMQQAGLNIPAPSRHGDQYIPVTVGAGGTLQSAKDNMGWWNRFWQGPNGEMYGELTVPNADDAKRIGKTIKETSVHVRPTFVDGNGQTWNEALMHVALITHPVEMGQENFEGLSLSMSMMDEENQSSANTDQNDDGDLNNTDTKLPSVPAKVVDLTQLRELLSKAARVQLPEDTTEENLVERLVGALLQKEASETPSFGKSPLRTPPEDANSQSRGALVTMSETTSIDADVVMSHPAYKNLERMNSGIMAILRSNQIEQLAGRIERLLAKGVIDANYVTNRLKPMMDSFQIAFAEDGSIQPTPLVQAVESLEALPARPQENVPQALALSMSHGDSSRFESLLQKLGGQVESPPDGITMSQKDVDDAVDRFMSLTR